jgi:hypothetical protein
MDGAGSSQCPVRRPITMAVTAMARGASTMAKVRTTATPSRELDVAQAVAAGKPDGGDRTPRRRAAPSASPVGSEPRWSRAAKQEPGD